MRHFIPVRRAIPLVAWAVLILAAPVRADLYYTAILDGPTSGNDSPATGTALFTLNDDETQVAYVIEYSGLLGTETVAHIHNAPPGVIGPVFHALEPGSPIIGTWAVGSFEVEELKAGRVNILIHTDLFGAGEIRGNVFFNSVAGEGDLPDEFIPADLVLKPNFPNPFNPVTSIRFGVPREGRVRLGIFDVRGRLVKNLVDEVRSPGFHTVTWNGTDDRGSRVASDVYLYRVVAGDRVRTGKLSLTK